MHDDSHGGPPMAAESTSVPVSAGDFLSIARYCGSPSGTPVLMIHGAIENGRIFHSRSGKGLAPWLASRGFDVFVADLRGHGDSRPHLGRDSAYGQTEMITEDIPALVDAVAAARPGARQAWVAHSWGGVVLNAFLARHPERISQVSAAVYFGSKRKVRAATFEALLKVRLIWNLLCPAVVAVAGYLPAARMGIGSDDDTAKYLRQCVRWVKEDRWIDPDDGFDYRAALAGLTLPPTWYVSAAADGALGHPADVRAFMEESTRSPLARYSILSEASGNLHDYDHIDMLTHPDAPRDHFPAVADWLASAGRAAAVASAAHAHRS